jgi:hypothetical protein
LARAKASAGAAFFTMLVAGARIRFVRDRMAAVPVMRVLGRFRSRRRVVRTCVQPRPVDRRRGLEGHRDEEDRELLESSPHAVHRSVVYPADTRGISSVDANSSTAGPLAL